MTKFILFRVGKGVGCDYTIGCNMTWEFLEAEEWEQARCEAEVIISEGETASAILVEVARHEDVDCEACFRRIEELKKQEQLEKERLEYERLRKKFG